MPSAQWAMKNYHRKWYAGETISVGIGQGAVEATPLQLARIIGGIASGGHMVRPHVVFPDQLQPDFPQGAAGVSFPGTGEANLPIDPENWNIITDGMAQVTQPGLYHTAGSAHLEGIDFAGKTGTAASGRPQRLQPHGRRATPLFPMTGLSACAPPQSRTGGRRALAERRIQLLSGPHRRARWWQPTSRSSAAWRTICSPSKPPAPPAPVEVGAIWSDPAPRSKRKGQRSKDQHDIQAGHYFVNANQRCQRSASKGRRRPRLQQAAGRKPCARDCFPNAAAEESHDTSTPLPQLSRLRLGICSPWCWCFAPSPSLKFIRPRSTPSFGFHTKQVFWIAGGLVAMFLFAKIDYHRLIDWAPWAYGVFLARPGRGRSWLGHKVLGARRWISVGPMHFQPSEWVKLVLILVVARYFANLGGR